jgi:uncharacterized protein YbaR (Trm112 family)
MAFDFAALEELLVCPKSKAKLVHDGERLVSTDPATRMAYEIRDEIPIMLVDEATELDESSWTEIMARHGRDPVTGDEK